jgi:hypothetical protein
MGRENVYSQGNSLAFLLMHEIEKRGGQANQGDGMGFETRKAPVFAENGAATETMGSRLAEDMPHLVETGEIYDNTTPLFSDAPGDSPSVSEIMGDGTPVAEILTAPIEGEPSEPPKGKRGRKKDPVNEILKGINFGNLAVTVHQLMYKACDTPEHPCEPITQPEADLVIDCTEQYVRHFVRTNPATGPLVPLMYLLIGNLVPVINRAPAIVPASVPFFTRVGNAIGSAVSWIQDKLGFQTPTKEV